MQCIDYLLEKDVFIAMVREVVRKPRDRLVLDDEGSLSKSLQQEFRLLLSRILSIEASYFFVCLPTYRVEKRYESM
jgi:hypothetical protein